MVEGRWERIDDASGKIPILVYVFFGWVFFFILTSKGLLNQQDGLIAV